MRRSTWFVSPSRVGSKTAHLFVGRASSPQFHSIRYGIPPQTEHNQHGDLPASQPPGMVDFAFCVDLERSPGCTEGNARRRGTATVDLLVSWSHCSNVVLGGSLILRFTLSSCSFCEWLGYISRSFGLGEDPILRRSTGIDQPPTRGVYDQPGGCLAVLLSSNH
jgi:hypothetical protein